MAVFRVGAYIPAPGVDAGALKALVDAQSGGPLGFLNAFTGGALGRFAVFSLGVMPFVNAAVVAGLFMRGRSRRERGAAARALTLAFALLQAFGLALALAKMTAPGGLPVVPDPDWIFYAAATLTLTAGALFVMWLCEEITESGIGGGTLLIVFTGLVGNALSGAGTLFRLLRFEEIGLFTALALAAALIAAVLAVVWIETAQRKLTVNYSQRVVGRRMYGGSSSALPVKLDQSGVVAAVSAASVTASLAALLLAAALIGGKSPSMLIQGGWIDDAIYAALIVFFCCFAGSRTINPNELADQLKKTGGSMPGIRPGDSTARHIQWVHEHLALCGALFVAAVAVLPDLLRRCFHLPFFFDGLQVLIVVGVALDAMGRVESHGLMRTYAKYIK
jgi:preprotein translocase subunit SecY